MKQEWTERPLEVSTEFGCRTLDTWNGHKYFTELVPCSTAGWTRAIFEGWCCHCSNLRLETRKFPQYVENVVVLCDHCGERMFRVSGIVSHEWKMETPRL